MSRRRNRYKSFQELRENRGALKVKHAVIDGELVCFDSEGRSIFSELLFRRGSPIFYAFDLLYLNGRDLRQLPLIERKEKLRAVIEKSALPDVICGKYVEGRGTDLFNEVVRRNLEGVVAKRKTAMYATVSGWLKINPNHTKGCAFEMARPTVPQSYSVPFETSEVRERFTLYRWVAARPVFTWNLILAVAILVSQLVPFVCLVITKL